MRLDMWPFRQKNITAKSVMQTPPEQAIVDERAEIILNVEELTRQMQRAIDSEINQISGPEYRIRSVDAWQRAMEYANQPYSSSFNNSWIDLFDIFENIIEDSDIDGAIALLKEGIKSKDFYLTDKDGNKLDESSRLMRSQWFYDFIDEVLDAWLWGFNLIKITEYDRGTQRIKVSSVNKKHVRPDLKGVVKYEYDQEAFRLWDNEPWKTWNIFVFHSNLGKLNKVVLWWIYKTEISRLWARFMTTFGKAGVVGKTKVKDTDRKNNLVSFLKNYVKSNFAVVDLEDVIEPMPTVGVGSPEWFENFVRLADEQINKALLTGVGTMDNSTNRSVSEVHQEGKNTIVSSLTRWLLFLSNDELLPRLRKIGMPIPKDAELTQDNSEKLTTKEKADVLDMLNRSYSVPANFASNYIGIELSDKEDQPFEGVKTNDDDD